MRTIKLSSAAALALTGVMVLGGCGSHGSPSGDTASLDERASGDSNAAGSAAMPAHAPARNAALNKSPRTPTSRSVVQTADVEVTSRDVGAAADDVRRIAGAHSGRVEDERTTADDGDVRREYLTLRVPSAKFEAVYAALKQVGDLVTATRSLEDVTTRVIDVNARVRSQRASLSRVRALLARARTIGQVMAIEAQLTRRQEQLESVEQRQAYLDDQTSLSTITVVITRRDAAASTATHRTGFVGGLQRGWHGLTVAAGGLATAAGVAVPFGVPALLIGLLAWVVVRRRRRVATP